MKRLIFGALVASIATAVAAPARAPKISLFIPTWTTWSRNTWSRSGLNSSRPERSIAPSGRLKERRVESGSE